MNKKIALIFILVLCVIVSILLFTCKKDIPSDSGVSTEKEQSNEDGERDDGVSVIIKDDEKNTANEDKDEDAVTEDDTWKDVKIEISDSPTDVTLSNTTDNESSSNKPEDSTSDDNSSSSDADDSVTEDDEKELPEYYPGAY